jgi:pimeloyl-ACP methyl ester carboxylesterase
MHFDHMTVQRMTDWLRGRAPRLVAHGTAGVLVVTTALVSLSSCVFTMPATARIGNAPADLDAASVAFRSRSGSTIHGWLARGRPGGGAVLLLHGVGANRLAMLDRARFLRDSGFTVLLTDFQAHGESQGRFITFGALESLDAAAALDFLRRVAPGERVGVIGVSMGGAASLVGPGPLHVDAMVLESVYPTIRDAITDRLRAWLGPVGGLAPELAPVVLAGVGEEIGVTERQLRPIDRIASVRTPVLVAAGDADRYTLPAESRALYDRVTSPKQLWLVHGAAHEDLHAFAPRDYESRIGGFLARYLREPAPVVAAAR